MNWNFKMTLKIQNLQRYCPGSVNQGEDQALRFAYAKLDTLLRS